MARTLRTEVSSQQETPQSRFKGYLNNDTSTNSVNLMHLRSIVSKNKSKKLQEEIKI